jgi:hypothetical protein
MNLSTDAECPTCRSNRVELMIRKSANGERAVLFQRCAGCGENLSIWVPQTAGV